MRTLVPYASIHADTQAGAPKDAVWVDVSGDDHAYWRCLSDWWAQGETFLVIEHDVVCRPDVIDAFENCPEPWCAFPYDDMCHWECMEAWANTLGCTRFDASLMRAVPDALSSIPEEQRDWHNLCDSIAGDKVGGMPAPLRPHSLREAGFTHHWHFPAIYHHHMDREGSRSFAEAARKTYPPGALV